MLNNEQKPNRILLIGKNGQVGWELLRSLQPLGEVIATGREDLNLLYPDQIKDVVRRVKPNIIINAAAYTAVDKAESEPDIAMAINGIAPGVLAEEAKKINSLLVHYSTDYVFDGKKNTPYSENDKPNPINMYGKSKLFGEEAIQTVGCNFLILRTSWVYGNHGLNFVKTILRLANEKKEIKIVDDQFGCPTWSIFIAQASLLILHGLQFHKSIDKLLGIYHLVSCDNTNWCEFAEIILKNACIEDVKITPIKTQDYITAAARPKYSVMSSKRIEDNFNIKVPSWKQQLSLAIK